MERKGLLSNHFSNRINLEHVPTKDCLFGVVAMAFNTLAEPSEKLMGVDVQTISEKNNIEKGDLETLFDTLNSTTAIKGLTLAYFPKIGDWTREDVFNIYSEVIDRGGLVFVGVDSTKWYNGVHSGRPHALLASGYEQVVPKYIGKEKRKLILHDPNIEVDLIADFDLLYPMIWPQYSSEFGIVAFFQKGNFPFTGTQPSKKPEI